MKKALVALLAFILCVIPVMGGETAYAASRTLKAGDI